MAVDSAGNLYIADYGNNRIRKVTKGPVNFGQVNLGANSPAEHTSLHQHRADSLQRIRQRRLFRA